MTQAVIKDPFQGPEEGPGWAWGPLLWGSSSPLLILLWPPCTSPSQPSLHWRLFPSSIHLRSFCFCLVAKSCLTLGHPMDCSPPGSSVLGILQTRILEWVVISSSRGSSNPGTEHASLTSPLAPPGKPCVCRTASIITYFCKLHFHMLLTCVWILRKNFGMHNKSFYYI